MTVDEKINFKDADFRITMVVAMKLMSSVDLVLHMQLFVGSPDAVPKMRIVSAR